MKNLVLYTKIRTDVGPFRPTWTNKPPDTCGVVLMIKLAVYIWVMQMKTRQHGSTSVSYPCFYKSVNNIYIYIYIIHGLSDKKWIMIEEVLSRGE
jgi:hypothetical protein